MVDELDEHMGSFDAPRQEVAGHVILRLEEILGRSGVEIISNEATFNRARHKPDADYSATDNGATVDETLSSGFAVGPRVLRRARVRCCERRSRTMIEEPAITSPGERGADHFDGRTRKPPFESANFRRAALVVNTRSRVGESSFRLALDCLSASGVPIGAAYALRDPTRLVETVQEALLEGHDLIILGGGDGSVSTVVDLLAESDAMLGLLPLGTANDFARTLRIPFDLEAACDTVAHGKIVDADLGLAGNNYYVNVASVGLGPEVVENLSPLLKQSARTLAYPIAAIRAYANHRPFSVSLDFPDGDHEPADLDGLLQVAVGNGRFYGGGMVVAPHSSIEDAALDVYTITARKGLELVRVVRGLRSGEFVENPCVRYWRTSRVRIKTDPALPINLDGELVSRTPKLFSVAPKAIKVLVPQTFWRIEANETSAACELALSR